jgi:tetratricopeptide (TPR) repeat protein
MTDSLAELLGHYIKRTGYSYGQLHRRTGVPKKSIANWVSGMVRRPHQWQGLVRLAAVFNLSEAETTRLLHAAGYPTVEHLLAVVGDEANRALLLPRVEEVARRRAEAPFQAVADLPHFVNRTEELRALQETLLSDRHNALYALTGPAGVGKTVLAARLAHELRPHFPDGVLWVHLNAADTMSILSAFAEAYGRNVSHYPTIESRSPVVRQVLANKRTLIILDDAQSSQQISPLLPPTGRCAVLITTRRRYLSIIRNARQFEVAPFDKQKGEDLALFTRILGQTQANRERALLGRIADLLGGLPLALDIAASRLAHDPYLTSSDYLERLRSVKNRLDELQYDDLNVRSSFRVSHEALESRLQQFLLLLGVFGGEDFDSNAVASVSQLTVEQAQAQLNQLYGYSLLQKGRPGRYQFHPLLRDYVREQNIPSAAFQRMAEYYAGVLQAARELYDKGGQQLKRGLALFDLEWRNIRAGQSWAAAHFDLPRAKALCHEYGLVAGFMLHLRLHTQDQICWWQVARRAARHLKQRGSEGGYLIQLGLAYHNSGQVHQAIKLYEKAQAIFQEIGDPENECNALDKLGLAYQRLSHYRQSIDYHEQALAIAHALGSPHREGNALGNLGVAYKNLGQFERAIEYHQRALPIARAEGDRQGEAATLNDLGSSYLDSGNLEKAIDCYEQALIINRDIGYRQGEGDALGNLGWACAQAGQFERAITFYQQALQLDGEMDNPYGQAITLNNLGEAHLELRQPSQALLFCRQALEIAQKYGFRSSEGDAFYNIGRALFEMGDRAAATTQAELALTIFNDIEDPMSAQVQESLALWANQEK